MVVLEPRMLRWVKSLARKEGLSISMVLRDLVKGAYESFEDRYWAREGERRLHSSKGKTIAHDAFWKKAGL